MKSPADLEKIAREIVDHVGTMDLSCNNFPDCDVITAIIAEHLTRIQDDAIASVLPDEEEIFRVSKVHESLSVELSDADFVAGAFWMRNKVLQLRDNMSQKRGEAEEISPKNVKPAPKKSDGQRLYDLWRQLGIKPPENVETIPDGVQMPSEEESREAFYKHIEDWGDDTVGMRSARATTWNVAVAWMKAQLRTAREGK